MASECDVTGVGETQAGEDDTADGRSIVRRTFSSLKIRNYRLYFAGQGLSMTGTWMQGVTQSWLVYSYTRSGFDIGLIVALQTLPILLFGPLGGAIADRVSKYRILFWTQGLAGVQALTLAGLDLSGNLKLWMLYPMAVMLGFINALDNPTRQTFISEMVGDAELKNAVTLNAIMVNVARAVGPAVAGVLIATAGSGWCFLANGVSFGFVLVSLAAMRKDELMPAPAATKAKGQLREGLRYVARTPVLRDSLVMMALVGCLTYEFQVTLPLMAGQVLHGGPQTYGALTAMMGIGAVFGGLASAGRPGRGINRLVWASAAFGLTVLGASLAPSVLIEEILLFIVGGASVSFLSLGSATLQLGADPSMRGRVMALWSVAFLGSTPIGGPLVGFIGNFAGPRFALGLGAAAALLAAGYGWSRQRAKGAERSSEAQSAVARA